MRNVALYPVDFAELLTGFDFIHTVGKPFLAEYLYAVVAFKTVKCHLVNGVGVLGFKVLIFLPGDKPLAVLGLVVSNFPDLNDEFVIFEVFDLVRREPF